VTDVKKILAVEDSKLTFELLRRALASSDRYSVEFFAKTRKTCSRSMSSITLILW